MRAPFHNISSYLKKDSIFIFSWDHPFMHCVDTVDEQLVEETDGEILACNCEFSSQYYSACKAKKISLSFIIKARKI